MPYVEHATMDTRSRAAPSRAAPAASFDISNPFLSNHLSLYHYESLDEPLSIYKANLSCSSIIMIHIHNQQEVEIQLLRGHCNQPSGIVYTDELEFVTFEFTFASIVA